MTRFVHGRVHQFNPLVPSRTSQVALDRDTRVLHSDEPVSMETHPREPTCSIRLVLSIAQHLSRAFYLLWSPCAHYQGWRQYNDDVLLWTACVHTLSECEWKVKPSEPLIRQSRLIHVSSEGSQKAKGGETKNYSLHASLLRNQQEGMWMEGKCEGDLYSRRMPANDQLAGNEFCFFKIIIRFLFDTAVNYSKLLLNLFSLTWLNYFPSSLGSG